MEVIKQNAGLEIDLKHIKVSLQFLMEDQSVKIKASRKFSNNLLGFEQLSKWLDSKKIDTLSVHLTMEATGVYSENVSYYFHEKENYIVHVVLPNTSKAFFKSHNFKSKTDEIDAKGLALMGLERKLPVWKPASPQMRTLKKLVRERIRLKREKTMISNQLHAEKASYRPQKDALDRYGKRIHFIDKQIKEIEDQLHNEVQKDNTLANKINNICQAKGIGFITAIGVVAELNGFTLFKNRNQVVSYTGYDVVKRESGTSVRGKTKISKKGNAYVRSMLYTAAMSAARFDDHHKAYYKRIVQKTGIPMKANVAIQRKLLLLIYTLFKDGNTFDEQHHIKMKKKIKAKTQTQCEQFEVQNLV